MYTTKVSSYWLPHVKAVESFGKSNFVLINQENQSYHHSKYVIFSRSFTFSKKIDYCSDFRSFFFLRWQKSHRIDPIFTELAKLKVLVIRIVLLLLNCPKIKKIVIIYNFYNWYGIVGRTKKASKQQVAGLKPIKICIFLHFLWPGGWDERAPKLQVVEDSNLGIGYMLFLHFVSETILKPTYFRRKESKESTVSGFKS